MFKIDVDETRRYGRVVLSGFWSEDTIDQYERALRQTFERLKQLGSPTRCLWDTTDMSVQSRVYAERLQQIVESLAALMPDRRAIVVGNALARLQAQRATAAVQEGHRMFETIEEAEAWLFEDDEA